MGAARVKCASLALMSLHVAIVSINPVGCDIALGVPERYSPGAGEMAEAVFKGVFLGSTPLAEAGLRPQISRILRGTAET